MKKFLQYGQEEMEKHGHDHRCVEIFIDAPKEVHQTPLLCIKAFEDTFVDRHRRLWARDAIRNHKENKTDTTNTDHPKKDNEPANQFLQCLPKVIQFVIPS